MQKRSSLFNKLTLALALLPFISTAVEADKLTIGQVAPQFELKTDVTQSVISATLHMPSC